MNRMIVIAGLFFFLISQQAFSFIVDDIEWNRISVDSHTYVPENAPERMELRVSTPSPGADLPRFTREDVPSDGPLPKEIILTANLDRVSFRFVIRPTCNGCLEIADTWERRLQNVHIGEYSVYVRDGQVEEEIEIPLPTPATKMEAPSWWSSSTGVLTMVAIGVATTLVAAVKFRISPRTLLFATLACLMSKQGRTGAKVLIATALPGATGPCGKPLSSCCCDNEQ